MVWTRFLDWMDSTKNMLQHKDNSLLLEMTVARWSAPLLSSSNNCSKTNPFLFKADFLRNSNPIKILVVSSKKTRPQCHNCKQNCYRKGEGQWREQRYTEYHGREGSSEVSRYLSKSKSPIFESIMWNLRNLCSHLSRLRKYFTLISPCQWKNICLDISTFLPSDTGNWLLSTPVWIVEE